MHVLQLGPVPPPEGGISRNILAIRKELIAEGHKCSVIATARASRRRTEPGFFYPRGPFELLKMLRHINFDVLHLHIGGEIPIRVLALILACGVLAKGKSVLTLHSGGYASALKEKVSYLSPAGITFRMFERLICVNSSMMSMFGHYGVDPERLKLIPPFSVEQPDRSVPVPNQLAAFATKHSPLLLTVGLLEDEYNLDDQIDALGDVLSAFPQAGLMIVGSGSLETALHEKIASKSYSNSVLLTGDVPHEVTLRFIDDCDVLLRTTDYDGDAISVREALFLGKPVVTTDNGMRPKGALLINNPIQREQLIERVLDALNHPTAPVSDNFSDGKENIRAILDLYRDIATI